MILLDTSFLFAFFQKSDTNHKQAQTLAQELNHKQGVAPVEVIQELITVLTNKVGSKEAIKIGNLLLDNGSPIDVVHSKSQRFIATWNNFQELSPHKLSYVDCLLYTMAYEFNAEVFTFDKHLKQQLSG